MYSVMFGFTPLTIKAIDSVYTYVVKTAYTFSKINLLSFIPLVLSQLLLIRER